MNRVDIRIDTLVLRGIDRTDAGAVTTAIERELQRTLAAAAIDWGAHAHSARLDAGQVRVAPSDGAGLGAAVARNITRGLLP